MCINTVGAQALSDSDSFGIDSPRLSMPCHDEPEAPAAGAAGVIRVPGHGPCEPHCQLGPGSVLACSSTVSDA